MHTHSTLLLAILFFIAHAEGTGGWTSIWVFFFFFFPIALLSDWPIADSLGAIVLQKPARPSARASSVFLQAGRSLAPLLSIYPDPFPPVSHCCCLIGFQWWLHCGHSSYSHATTRLCWLQGVILYPHTSETARHFASRSTGILLKIHRWK